MQFIIVASSLANLLSYHISVSLKYQIAMDIFIVTNQALHYDSSYYEIIGAFKTLKDAQICVETSVKDFYSRLDKGDFSKSFSFSNIEETSTDLSYELEDVKTGYFEYFKIVTIALEGE